MQQNETKCKELEKILQGTQPGKQWPRFTGNESSDTVQQYKMKSSINSVNDKSHKTYASMNDGMNKNSSAMSSNSSEMTEKERADLETKRAEKREKLKTTKIKVPPHREAEIRELISEYIDIFADSIMELGFSKLAQHHIETGDAQPYVAPLYRSNPIKNQEIYDFVMELLKAVMIEPSNSPWRNNVLLVDKKDGMSKRFCVDMRHLNKVTKKDNYLIPHPLSVFDELAGSSVFTTIDCHSSFWQQELTESSREKTAFSTVSPPLHFQFRRLVMGLSNASNSWQRLMLQILRPVLRRTTICFIDDLLLYGNDEAQHLKDIREVFELLKEHGIKMKLKKCSFFDTSTTFMGHQIDKNGVAPDPVKLQKIADLPPPSSLRQLQQFLGAVAYYNRMIKNFSTIAAPLYGKLKKENRGKWSWSQKEQEVFEQLTSCLITEPVVLAYPRFDRPFLLAVDASSTGLGACLSQITNGVERPVAYASRKLKDSETR